MAESGIVTESTDVSLEAKAKVSHTLVLPMTRFGWEGWTVKEAEREK